VEGVAVDEVVDAVAIMRQHRLLPRRFILRVS